MGSVFSKSASKISPPRKYPLRPPPPPHRSAPSATSRPSAKRTTQADFTNPSSEPLEYTAPTPEPFDPKYAAFLRRLGSVQPIDPFAAPPHQPPSTSSPSTTTTTSNNNNNNIPQPTFPPSSSFSTSPLTANPALQVLTRRRDIQRAAEAEFAHTLEAGTEHQRSFLDAVTLRRVLVLRDRGVPGGEIEREMGLREGLVGRLGRRGVVSPAGMGGLVG